MSVPNTNTFALSDVIPEVGLAPPSSLGACFANAVDWKFDPQYKGDKDRLSNFRNYGGEKEFNISPSKHQSIYVTGTGWASVRGATTGTLDPGNENPARMHQWVECPSADHYTIHRNFMEFDLSLIPATANIVSAYLDFRVVDEYSGEGVNNIDIVRATFGTSIGEIDYDSFTTDTFFTGNLSSYTDHGNKILRKEALTGDLNNIKNYFGDILKACIRHSYDFINTTPVLGEKIGYTSWQSGESLTNYFDVPILHIVYQ